MAPRKGERSLSSLERAGEVRRQIRPGCARPNFGELAHADGEVLCRAPIGDLDLDRHPDPRLPSH